MKSPPLQEGIQYHKATYHSVFFCFRLFITTSKFSLCSTDLALMAICSAYKLFFDGHKMEKIEPEQKLTNLTCIFKCLLDSETIKLLFIAVRI